MEGDSSQIGHTIKRAEIRSHLTAGEGIRATIDAVNSNRSTRQELVGKLLSEVIIPDPQLLEINHYLYDHLHSNFSNVVAIGLAGSGVHGGMLVRKHLHNLEGSDFDGFAVVKQNPRETPYTDDQERRTVGTQELMDLRANAQLLLKTLIEKNDPLIQGLPSDFDICWGASNYINSPIQDISGMNDGALVNLMADDRSAKFVNLFLPTYPPGVNITASQKIVEVLTSLSDNNPDLWKTITTRMKGRWKILHGIRSKNLDPNSFGDETTDKRYDQDARDRISQEMTAPFNGLIDATGNR